MDRRAALIIAGSFSVLAFAKKPTETKKKPGHAIHLRSIDLARRYALIELSGVSKPPAPNLFTFTDERKRHYVAMGITCDPPFPSGIRACELAIPEGYERHRLVSLELHLGGLHSRTIEVPPGEIASAWEAAMATKVEPPKEIVPSPSPTPSPKPNAKAPTAKAPAAPPAKAPAAPPAKTPPAATKPSPSPAPAPKKK